MEALGNHEELRTYYYMNNITSLGHDVLCVHRFYSVYLHVSVLDSVIYIRTCLSRQIIHKRINGSGVQCNMIT